MTKFILPALVAAVAVLPATASAQALPAAIVGVVDVQRATSDCNACKTALNQLETQVNSFRALQTSLETSIRAEQTSLQTAVTALNGKQPDAALTARITAYQRKEASAQQQLTARDQAFQRNRSYVLQQIGEKLNPVLTSVQSRRGITVLLDAANVLRVAPAIDVTNDVIAGLNASLTTVGTTAPAQAQTAPKGR